MQNFDPENFDRFGLSKKTDKRIPGIEAVKKYLKLMVLGNPGAGKTTFLKHLAFQCNKANLKAELVPIFITLKQFAEIEEKPSLLEYITHILDDYDVSGKQIDILLKYGKLLILLDGLDEVKVEDNNRIIKQVCNLSDKFHKNKFVISCRIAAKTYNFDKFTEVEVADFDQKQINTFVGKWFNGEESAIAEQFIEQLEQNCRIQELATNPLLLTLLCLVFEDSLKFPAHRSELYEEGIDILLKKWDETRNIERDQVYKNLSLQRKKDLLSQIALTTFERGDYFFKQKELEQYISDYIHNLPDAQNDPEALQLDSEAVLKSIEAQHGLLVERAQKIYSFSHLTFQEYFTAKKIVINCNSYSSDQDDWQILISRIHNKRWREVFLLVVEMLPSADFLLFLIKRHIDGLLATDEKLQQFLYWVNRKSCSVQVPFKKNAVRAFYFDVTLAPASKSSPDLECSLGLAFKLDSNLEFHENFEIIPIDLKLDFCLSATLAHAIDNGIDPDFVVPECGFNFNLWKSLQKLEQEIPDWRDHLLFAQWISENGQTWTEKYRSLMIKYRKIGYNWQFNEEQNKLLKKYSDANELLIDCLNSGCKVSPNVRDEIEQTLLLPISEIHPK
ncbi:NACHT domain-containing NTPase [Planktothrix sp. FACHB-1365]|uniref:NACHT domain-containing protein n=1 Tax=Planktothrix sp. FACHB-1365 TaxID=2692855 RepID=UPI001682AC84|nr:NACHT domain-containing NTPase [Planktothrix sp. FACHB-1365]MBD2480522.1 NACHT domain-containing NTPase [Planktothrix sp. FACHB-1365]